MKYRVLSEHRVEREDEDPEVTVVIESERIDRKAAELDVDLLRMLGKRVWLEEVK